MAYFSWTRGLSLMTMHNPLSQFQSLKSSSGSIPVLAHASITQKIRGCHDHSPSSNLPWQRTIPYLQTMFLSIFASNERLDFWRIISKRISNKWWQFVPHNPPQLSQEKTLCRSRPAPMQPIGSSSGHKSLASRNKRRVLEPSQNRTGTLTNMELSKH
jgi:hypothetical protein